MRYTAAFKLTGPLAAAVAVEWTDIDAPLSSGAGWEACVKLPNGDWRFSSHAIASGEAAWRDPGLFDNIGLRYRLGAASPWSPVSASRKEITLVAVIEESPPLAVSAPTLTGAGKIGAVMTLDPGVWTGTPAPSLAQQWRRDGADIPGATLASYTPGPADDLTDLSCAVTASSLAGTAVALAGPIRITHVAPVAAGNLLEEIFDQGSGAQTVATAGDFTGAALRFAVTGAGASIDAATGVVSIPTDVAVSGETVTVTASNSGGSAASSFLVTIEAAEVELPPALTVAEWEVEPVADPLLAGNPLVGMIRVLSGPALGATRLYRTSLNPTDGYYPGKGFEVCIRHPDTANYANCWLWRSNSATATFHLLDAKIGQTIQTVVRYTLDDAATVAVADAVFSLDSDRKSWVVTGAPVFTVHPTLSGTGRINSQVTFNSGTATGAPTPTKTKAWYLNGVAIPGLTAGSYTPVSADLGKALTGREVATNLTGSTTSNFTNKITIISATGDYVRVTNKADLQIELNRAVQGRIIECDGGEYPSTVVATAGAKTFGQRVTIVAQNRTDPPIFTEGAFNLSGWNGLILDGLHFVNSRVDSQGDPDGKINIINCSNIKIIDCYFRKQHESLRTDNSVNMEIAYCTFEEQGMEAGRFYANQTNFWIHHCKVWRTAINESRTGEGDRHPDGFQFAVNGTNIPPDGVRVEDCWIENRQTGHSMHGVFFGNNATRDVARGGLGKSLTESGYRNIAVRRCYMHLGHIQGIYFEGMTNGVAEQNLMRTIPGITSSGDMPTVYLNWQKFVNIDLINNVTPRSFFIKEAPGAQVSQIGNVISNTAVPTGWASTDMGMTLANPGSPRVGQYAAR